MNNNIKYLLLKSAQYERQAILSENNYKLHKVAYLNLILHGVGYALTAGLGAGFLKGLLDIGDATAEIPTHLSECITSINNIIASQGNDPEFSKHKENFGKFRDACISAKSYFPKIFSTNATKDSNFTENIKKYMEAIQVIKELYYFIISVLEKTKGVSGALYDLTHMVHGGLLDSLVSDRKVLTQHVNLLMQEITLQEPMLIKQLKEFSEKGKDLAQTQESGAASVAPEIKAPAIKSKSKSDKGSSSVVNPFSSWS